MKQIDIKSDKFFLCFGAMFVLSLTLVNISTAQAQSVIDLDIDLRDSGEPELAPFIDDEGPLGCNVVVAGDTGKNNPDDDLLANLRELSPHLAPSTPGNFLFADDDILRPDPDDLIEDDLINPPSPTNGSCDGVTALMYEGVQYEVEWMEVCGECEIKMIREPITRHYGCNDNYLHRMSYVPYYHSRWYAEQDLSAQGGPACQALLAEENVSRTSKFTDQNVCSSVCPCSGVSGFYDNSLRIAPIVYNTEGFELDYYTDPDNFVYTHYRNWNEIREACGGLDVDELQQNPDYLGYEQLNVIDGANYLPRSWFDIRYGKQAHTSSPETPEEWD